jgi:hypothetical protein
VTDKPLATITFADLETTSVARPWARHGRRAWEIALIRYEPNGATQRLHIVVSDVDLADSSDESLEKGGFSRRHPRGGGAVPLGARYMPEQVAALAVAAFTAGTWLCGANRPFDEETLADMLVRHRVVDPLDGLNPFPWDYHDFDVESYAAGRLGLAPPWSSFRLAGALGVPRDAAGEPHSAMADAEWCVLVWEALHRAGPDDVMALADAVQSAPA